NDTYAVYGIMLPDAYISDNETKTGASWDMFREAARYLYENEDQKFTFTGELQGLWAKENWLIIGGKLILGGYINFTDTQFAEEGVLIRITGMKEFLTSPYSPIIELSNSISGKSFTSTIKEIEGEEVINEERTKGVLQYTKRRFRDAKETMSLLENSFLNFDKGINPIFVQTMQLLVGDESLQFRFVNNKTNPTQVSHIINFDAETKILTANSGIIQHMTLGINTIKETHSATEYKFWDISKYDSPVLDQPDKPYYLYAKVSKETNSGTFLLSEAPIKIESVAGYNHLLVGILNSEFEGERSFVTLYGFTEILPGRITTDKIISADGKTYFDLAGGEIGGKIKFLNSNNELEDIEKVKLYLQYSVNGSSWHDVYNINDKYMRQKNGADGEWSDAMPIGKGEDGVGIVSTVDFYGVSNHPSILPIYFYEGVIPSKTESQYLWRYEKITYTDNTYSTTTPRVIVGKDPRGISEIKNAFTYSSSNTTVVNSPGWQWTIAALGARPAGYFLWMRDDIFYTDGTSSSTVERLVVEGKDGDDAFADPAIIAKINESAAVTDKFGTTIDGGLINTVMMLLREANSTINTAGISGIQGALRDNPAFWAGGEYEKAFRLISFLSAMSKETPAGTGDDQYNYSAQYLQLAKITMLHNGAAKIGDFIIEESGRIVMIDPTTGIARLVFSIENLPSIDDLIAGAYSAGSVNIGSGSTSTSITLPGSANVTQTDGTMTIGPMSLTISGSGRSDQFGRSSFIDVKLVLYRGSVSVRTLWTSSVFFLGDDYHYDSETRDFNEHTFNISGKGIYTFKLEVSRLGDISTASGSSTSFSLAWDASLAGVKRQQYGLDGMMFYYSFLHFYYTESRGLDIRGKTNMPGVLASASVTSNGNQNNGWGAKLSPYGASTITGGFRVPLKDLSHNSYTVQITPHTSTSAFRVTIKTSTYFEVQGSGAFDYTVIGNNY
ncbi:MAG: hypothetical protein PHN55_12045, partial [Dysgonamonadaceae bacterium]|nr:hypothetical protein [Dysgonamonadaceae bacterium]